MSSHHSYPPPGDPGYRRIYVAPDGSNARARVVPYRGIYSIVWTGEGVTKRISLRTRNVEIAKSRAEVMCGLISNRDEALKSPSRRYWLTKRMVAARGRAKQLGAPFTLTIEDMEAMYERSSGRCEVSGIQFDMSLGKKGWRQPWRLSLDQIEAGMGYTPENCRLVCFAVNTALGAWGSEVLLTLARGVVAKADAATIGQWDGSSAGEHSLHTRGVAGSIPARPTTPLDVKEDLVQTARRWFERRGDPAGT